MAETAISFDDGAAYERFMGRWSRAVGDIFLDWVAPPRGVNWLDVGCGTGVFTELVLDRCTPASIAAVDPAPAQVEHARNQPFAQGVDIRVADAEALPFPDHSFDVVASALVINFIPNRPRALAEMHRVARPGGTVAGYVWDFAAEGAPNWPLRLGLRQIGAEVPVMPGTEESRLDALHGLFARIGFVDIVTRMIDATVAYRDFDDFWLAQTPSYHPLSKMIAALPQSERIKLDAAVRATMRPGPDGGVAYSARANAIKARVPG